MENHVGPAMGLRIMIQWTGIMNLLIPEGKIVENSRSNRNEIMNILIWNNNQTIP